MAGIQRYPVPVTPHATCAVQPYGTMLIRDLNENLHCPLCGYRLYPLTTSYRPHDKPDTHLNFYGLILACAKCEILFTCEKSSGINFQTIGFLTKDITAMIVAQHLTAKEESK